LKRNINTHFSNVSGSLFVSGTTGTRHVFAWHPGPAFLTSRSRQPAPANIPLKPIILSNAVSIDVSISNAVGDLG